MANAFNVSSLIAKEVVATLSSEGNMINTVDKTRAKDLEGRSYRGGTTVTVDIEPQFSVTSGRVATVQDATHSSVAISVNQFNAAIQWTSMEKSFSMPQVQKYAQNLGRRILRKMETDGLALASGVALNVGTSGTEPANYRNWADGYAKARTFLSPDRGVYGAVTPMGMAAMSDSLKGLQNPADDVGNQYVKGRVKKMAGINFFESPSVFRHTGGTQATNVLLVNGAAQIGASLIVDTGTGSSTITAGTKFTIAGVFAVDPETKTTLSFLREFTTTAALTLASGAGTLAISPAIVTSGGNQNVSTGPGDNAAITIMGSAFNSQAGSQNLIYQEDAITLVSLPLMAAETKGTHSYADYDGIQVRVGFGGWDALNDTEILRVDLVYGWGILRQDHCAVVWGA
ncbi:MAG: hypothetical protein M3Y08_18200 [Fibrobacterota bacterium]|nr:hypothetical protein [Fibrobacterota bacterium]